jgi:hypothetical protein
MKPTFSDLLPQSHTHTHTYVEGERERERAMLPTKPTAKSYHPDFSLICEARVNGKPCLACLIWEVTERPAVSVSSVLVSACCRGLKFSSYIM